jgi:hypothetical protein
MPIYKGSTEVTSGNLYKGSTEIQDGYKATDSFYVNQTVISFSDYPGVTPNPKTFSGVPGDPVSPAANVSWSITAASGQAYQNAPTISGLQSPFTYSVSGYGSVSNTTATFTVSGPTTYPSNGVSSDYDDLTISAPTSTVNSATLTITTPNFSGSGGGTFGSTVTGGISGASIQNNATGGSGTACGAGAYGFTDWSIPGVPSPSPSPFQSTVSKSVPNIPAPGSYSGTVSSAGALTWGAWLPLIDESSDPLCTAPYVRCYDWSATWTGAGGGNLQWSRSGGACDVYLNSIVRCTASATTLNVQFSVTGNAYGGSCTVNYTGL